MKRMAMGLSLLAIGFFPLAASLSRAADTGTQASHHTEAAGTFEDGPRYCMAGSAMMQGAAMSGMMAGVMRHGENAASAPECGMSREDCASNHAAACGHESARELRMNECGA